MKSIEYDPDGWKKANEDFREHWQDEEGLWHAENSDIKIKIWAQMKDKIRFAANKEGITMGKWIRDAISVRLHYDKDLGDK